MTTRISWTDLDPGGKRILVRDMKNPGERIGNDVWCNLPEPAMRITKSRPKGACDKIFPYNGDAIGAAFTRTCKFPGICNLHFHDFRHDGVSRLFEIGLNIVRWSAERRLAATCSNVRSMAAERLPKYGQCPYTQDSCAAAASTGRC